MYHYLFGIISLVIYLIISWVVMEKILVAKKEFKTKYYIRDFVIMISVFLLKYICSLALDSSFLPVLSKNKLC